MNTCRFVSSAGIALAVLLLAASVPGDQPGAPVAKGIERAGANRAQLEAALQAVPKDQLTGMQWLIEHMPERDAQALTKEFLLEHCDEAYRAWRAAPWHASVSEDLFFDCILPYASVTERREAWRNPLRERAAPLVADAETPAEAAVILNREIFRLLGVKYSKERLRPDQGPIETIESGMASCTGLAILLVDACRAVGVPARVAGIPMWPDGSGNHTWVEIWDGSWHFTGAAEPARGKLDKAWFTGRASTAKRDDPLHAIYAVTWSNSPISFPMAWGPQDTSVRAMNVTDRYATPSTAVPDAKPEAAVASRRALEDLCMYVGASGVTELPGQPFAFVPLTRDDAEAARDVIWQAYASSIRERCAKELASGAIEINGVRMPVWYKAYGAAPEDGRSLFISMHGGGNSPAAVNDGQWENQKRLYRPAEGIYVAPRAPTDAWNMWHQGHIDGLFARLIEDMVIAEGVNPDRVYIMGYSAGGDGVYQLAPRMADQLAAAAMMSGHPNQARPDGLRNIGFTLHVGGKDAAFGRNAVAARWKAMLDELAQKDPGGYPHWVEVHEKKGHWMDLEDAAALPWMAKFVRDPVPEKIVWFQDDVVHTRFYWLATSEPKRGARVVASRKGQTIRIDEAAGVKDLSIRLDDRMCDLSRPVVVTRGDAVLFEGVVTRTIATIARTLTERGDPKALFTGEVELRLEE